MTPFNWFEHIYCINAIPERREAMKQRLQRIGFRTDPLSSASKGYASFVSVKTPDPALKMSNMRRAAAPEFGINLGHVKAIMESVIWRVRRPLFIEDDVIFDESAEHRLRIAIEEMKSDCEKHKTDWSVLYLGGHPCEDVERVGEHCVRTGRFSFAEAYCLNNPDGFLHFWFDRIGQPNAMFDRILGEYAKQYGGYCVYPVITSQENLVSSVAGKVDDKSHCIESGWKNHLK